MINPILFTRTRTAVGRMVLAIITWRVTAAVLCG
jgi:hypothetical protein